jgi:hypothetical protein
MYAGDSPEMRAPMKKHQAIAVAILIIFRFLLHFKGSFGELLGCGTRTISPRPSPYSTWRIPSVSINCTVPGTAGLVVMTTDGGC